MNPFHPLAKATSHRAKPRRTRQKLTGAFIECEEEIDLVLTALANEMCDSWVCLGATSHCFLTRSCLDR
jgi:hypothetical protein